MSLFRDIVLFIIVIILSKVFNRILEKQRTAPSSKRYYEDGEFNLIELSNMDPYDFEWWCADLLKDAGYGNVEVTPEKIDGGKDIICNKDGEKIYVECKRYQFNNKSEFQVSRDIVQKLVGAMVADRIHKGIIITTGIVTDRSREYVKNLPKGYRVELYDGEELMNFYRNTINNKEIEVHGELAEE